MTPIRYIALLCALPLSGAATLDAILARMDQSAVSFKAMSAKVRQVSHIAVINEDNVGIGSVRMKRMKRDAQFLAEFTSPEPKSFALAGAKLELYYPKASTVEQYDLGKNRVEKYLALGFGASGKELRTDYDLKELGVETVNGEKAARLELIPKSQQVLQQFPRIELWISEAKGYPVQQKLHQTGGDYMMITYSDVAINPPLPDSAYKLNLPRGVARLFPGK
jgi:outer membrane lipoprotein-sorting protein